MSYHEALEAAGATIHEFQEFGSYQGDWWALVTIDGEKAWIHGSFGSCSGCDSFEAEFGSQDDKCEPHRWEYNVPACADCDKAKQEYRKRLAEFGRGYLTSLLTQEEAEKEAGRHVEWDSEAPEMLKFVKEHAVNA
jgi:hypothetical protein